MKNILLFLALFIAACWSCKDDHQSADVDQSAKYDHIVDELCHSYIDTCMLSDKHYVLEYSFKKDGTAHLIYYSDRNYDNELEIDSMLIHWELPHTPEATSDGYELYDVSLVYYLEENLPANLIERYKDSIDFTPITDSQPIMVTPEQEVYLLVEEEDGVSAQTRGFFDSLLDAGKSIVDGAVDTFWNTVHVVKKTADIVTKPVTIAGQAINKLGDMLFTDFGPMEYKDWMKNIDDSMPICKLSIPGTHDTFTFNTAITSTVAGTQRCGISQQWDLGVRCFDIRLEYDYMNLFSSKLVLTHGGFVFLDYNIVEAFDVIKEKLDANKSETSILIVKFDEDHGYGKAATAELDEFLHERIKKDQIVKWRKDLTLEEARGKFIVIARYLPADSLVREYIPKVSKWDKNLPDQYLRMLDPKTKDESAVDSTLLWVQDKYEQNGEDKDEYVAIKNRMISDNFLALNNEYADGNVWAFNHTSGYVKAVTNFSNIATIVGGIVNSEFVSSYTAPYTEKLIKSYDDYTTGVIMIDYAGVGPARTLPETVLKKNY